MWYAILCQRGAWKKNEEHKLLGHVTKNVPHRDGRARKIDVEKERSQARGIVPVTHGE